jgi:hypothetical protein
MKRSILVLVNLLTMNPPPSTNQLRKKVEEVEYPASVRAEEVRA